MPPAQVAVATLRRGKEIMHIYSDALAVQLAGKMESERQSVSEHLLVAHDNILVKAQVSAKIAHDRILKAYPELQGAASMNLGTALRVRTVRAGLAGRAGGRAERARRPRRAGARRAAWRAAERAQPTG